MSYGIGMVNVITVEFADKFMKAEAADDYATMDAMEAEAGDGFSRSVVRGVALDRKPMAYLPHSCDEWEIGGPEDVRAMIADLSAALEKMGG